MLFFPHRILPRLAGGQNGYQLNVGQKNNNIQVGWAACCLATQNFTRPWECWVEKSVQPNLHFVPL
ncbi:hypothetical protein CRENPOLYSF1_410018 [Crenothrix polyspora]|uniref:Uncharacterized protein n=1 Tax=Crenothrix polyspora TaxID=360316 RepID=A0A1R4HAI9_9GAMM|nr:hypothetical protein CRENPOLYSF1_410018 [Crenothrix polyspora]